MSFNSGDALFQLVYLFFIILIGIAIYTFFVSRKTQKRKIRSLEEKVAKLEKRLYNKEK